MLGHPPMNLLAITQHGLLVEHLRMAFEGAGHQVHHVPDALQALAAEAWNDAQAILVDAEGDPLDGFRLCHLLRGESRVLFQNLPIFLILQDPPTEDQREALREVDGDGFLEVDQGLDGILETLGPAIGGEAHRSSGPPVPVVATGLSRATLARAREVLSHFHFQVHDAGARGFEEAVRTLAPRLALIGVQGTGTGALNRLAALRRLEQKPHTILLGQTDDEGAERRLLLQGAGNWLPLPASAPRLLHACRQGLEWLHAKRIQREFEHQISDLRERRTMLEIEAAALRNEVLTDPLTGLLNRRAFDQNFEHALRQWERHHRAFALILGDLDHFKLINDRFGHVVGDNVLRVLAQRLRGALRRSDLAFRIGGEEFAVLLMETQLKAALEVAEKLRKRVEEDPVPLENGQNIFPSMSFGVGIPEHFDGHQLYAAVDKALYMAKNRGRNCVVLAEAGAAFPAPRPTA